MKIISGKHKGKTATLAQYANDWMTVDIDEGPANQVLRPVQVVLTTDQEKARFTTHPDVGTGTFFDEWELLPSGGFAYRRAGVTA